MEPRLILEKLLRREDLTPAEIQALFEALTSDEGHGRLSAELDRDGASGSSAAPAEQKAGLLVALRAKGESVAEIAGMAAQMRRRAVRLPESMRHALDTCGTGGDGSCTLNISTLSALTLASMGVPVVKHGNRSVSSSCGSADVLEKLGCPLDLSPEQSAALFQKTKFAFLFAPLYHPAMKAVAPVRKALQIRTIFNFLGPLANPALVSHQVLGVPDESRVRPFAEVLRELGLTSAVVVHGEGTDEIMPFGKTHVAAFLNGGAIFEETWSAKDLGIPQAHRDDLRVAGVDEAVSRARAVLAGKGRPADTAAVALNAAAGLYIYGEAKAMDKAIRRVQEHLTSGDAGRHLERIIGVAKNGGSS